MAKFSKSNFRLIIQEIEEAEKCLENIWIPIGILEIMYDDYSGIIDKYFHSEEKDRDIDKLWDNLQPESKVTSKDLCINVAPKNPNVHNTLPYWYTQQYDRDFSNVGHITVPCSNKEEWPYKSINATWTCEDSLTPKPHKYDNTIRATWIDETRMRPTNTGQNDPKFGYTYV